MTSKTLAMTGEKECKVSRCALTQNDKGEAFTHCFSGLLRQRLCAIVFDCFTIRGAKYRATRSHAMTREKGSHAMTGEATEWQERVE